MQWNPHTCQKDGWEGEVMTKEAMIYPTYEHGLDIICCKKGGVCVVQRKHIYQSGVDAPWGRDDIINGCNFSIYGHIPYIEYSWNDGEQLGCLK